MLSTALAGISIRIGIGITRALLRHGGGVEKRKIDKVGVSKYSSHVTGSLPKCAASPRRDSTLASALVSLNALFFLLIFLMVICTSCQKKFKKPHGLSQHRNKCSALRLEPVYKSKKILLKQNLKAFRTPNAILKFKKKNRTETTFTFHSRRSQ